MQTVPSFPRLAAGSTIVFRLCALVSTHTYHKVEMESFGKLGKLGKAFNIH